MYQREYLYAYMPYIKQFDATFWPNKSASKASTIIWTSSVTLYKFTSSLPQDINSTQTFQQSLPRGMWWTFALGSIYAIFPLVIIHQHHLNTNSITTILHSHNDHFLTLYCFLVVTISNKNIDLQFIRVRNKIWLSQHFFLLNETFLLSITQG